MKVRYLFYYASAFIYILFLSSCNHLGGFEPTYKPQPPIKEEGFPVKNPIFISNIIDGRATYEKAQLDPDTNPLLLIPLWPYAHTETSPVLKYTFMQSDMFNTVKHLIAEDIRVSGIFSYATTQTYGVMGSKEAEYAAKIPDNAYILDIEVKQATWSRYLTTYGLSSAGTVLWLFLPESYGSVTISIIARLYSPSNRENPMDVTIITRKANCTEWAYDQINYLPPISEFKIAEMFPEIMTELRVFLVNSLNNKK